MNEKELKNYLKTVSIFAPKQKQQNYIFEELKKLDITIQDITKPMKSYLFIRYGMYNCITNFNNTREDLKLIYFSDFKKLIKKLEKHYLFESDLLVIDFNLNDFSKSKIIKNETNITISIKNIYYNLLTLNPCCIFIGDKKGYKDNLCKYDCFKLLKQQLLELKQQGI